MDKHLLSIEMARSCFQIYSSLRCMQEILRLKQKGKLFDFDATPSDAAKDVLLKQAVFDVLDLLYEITRSKPQYPSVVHHTVAVAAMCVPSLSSLATQALVVPVLAAFANQWSGAIGFNVYKVLSRYRSSNASRMATVRHIGHKIQWLIFVLELVYRYPILFWIAMYEMKHLRQNGIASRRRVGAALHMFWMIGTGLCLEYIWTKDAMEKLRLYSPRNVTIVIAVSFLFAVTVAQKYWFNTAQIRDSVQCDEYDSQHKQD